MLDLLSDDPARSPRYLLSLIEWLPDDGAFIACVQDAATPGSGREPEGPHRFYGRGLMWHILADLWEQGMAVGMAGSKKKVPSYPRPANKPRPRSLMSFFPGRPGP